MNRRANMCEISSAGITQLQEERKWRWLMDQIRPGMEADEREFVELDAEEIIRAAKKEKAVDAA